MKQKTASHEANFISNNGLSQRETGQNGSVNLLPVATQILESYPFSAQPSSSTCTETSYATTDSSTAGLTNSYDSSLASPLNISGQGQVEHYQTLTASTETVAELSGNFWTEPFFADNCYMANDSMAPMVDPEILFHPPLSGELLYSDGIYNGHELW